MMRPTHAAALAGSLVLIAVCIGVARSSDNPQRPTTLSVKVFDTHGAPVADAVVFDYPLTDRKFRPPAQPYVMDQINKEYVPHVLPILVGSRVRFPNKDDVHHDLYSFSPAKTFEIPLYKGEPAHPVLFDKTGVVQLGCNIHDWMSGIILVLPNPYFGKTDKTGKTTLSGFPSNSDLVLAVFHERLMGKVEDTLQTVHWDTFDGKPLIWKINLKPEHKKIRPAIEY
jgi:plastocyanin